MNKAGTTTAIKDDIDIQYREIAISAGWVLFVQRTTMTATEFASSTNYFSQAAPSKLDFNSQTVDFARFLEAEPDSTYISATKPVVCIATLLAVTFATLF